MNTCIPLTRGLVALVDADDAVVLSAYRWQAIEAKPGLWYAQRADGLYMHRMILGLDAIRARQSAVCWRGGGMRESIQIAHDGHSCAVITRAGRRPGWLRSQVYQRVSKASLRRLERVARVMGLQPVPEQYRLPDWWQREKR